jgi:hypothetical protein
MLAFPGEVRIYVAVQPVYMRKQFNGLWAAAQEQLGEGCPLPPAGDDLQRRPNPAAAHPLAASQRFVAHQRRTSSRSYETFPVVALVVTIPSRGHSRLRLTMTDPNGEMQIPGPQFYKPITSFTSSFVF